MYIYLFYFSFFDSALSLHFALFWKTIRLSLIRNFFPTLLSISVLKLDKIRLMNVTSLLSKMSKKNKQTSNVFGALLEKDKIPKCWDSRSDSEIPNKKILVGLSQQVIHMLQTHSYKRCGLINMFEATSTLLISNKWNYGTDWTLGIRFRCDCLPSLPDGKTSSLLRYDVL